MPESIYEVVALACAVFVAAGFGFAASSVLGGAAVSIFFFIMLTKKGFRTHQKGTFCD
jgi:hypothetical protein